MINNASIICPIKKDAPDAIITMYIRGLLNCLKKRSIPDILFAFGSTFFPKELSRPDASKSLNPFIDVCKCDIAELDDIA